MIAAAPDRYRVQTLRDFISMFTSRIDILPKCRTSRITETCRHLIRQVASVGAVTTRSSHVRGYADTMGRAQSQAELAGWLVGRLFRSSAESALTWPDLRNFAPYPYLPPSPFTVLPASPCPPLVAVLPFQRSTARSYPSGKPTLLAYLRGMEREAMFLLAHPFPALRRSVIPAV